MNKILVTGGCGFIGSNWVDRLLARGENVVAFDNMSRRGSEKNAAWLRGKYGAKFQLVQGDIRDAQAITDAARDADAIYHLAAQVTVTTSVTDPRNDFEINALGTFNVLEAARASGRNPIFVFASTNKVYGGMEDVVVVEKATRYEYGDLPNGVSEAQPLDFHSPYGCCYSEETDILTRTGWKKFYDLVPEDTVLTFNIKRRIAEFQKPTAHFAYPYKGKMYVQSNRRLKTCVTPNHKMLVSWDCNHNDLENPHLIEAQQIKGKPMAYLLAADFSQGEDCNQFVLPEIIPSKHKHKFPSKSIPMFDWLRFLGWYISEGHCYESKKTGNCIVSLTTFYRTAEAVAVMKAIGLSPVVDHHHIIATSKQLYTYLRSLGKSHAKYIPQNIKQLKPKYLEVLLESLLAGDGNKQGKNGWRYTTVSKQLADDVQEIAIKCGMAANLRFDKEGFYRVYICTTRTTQCNLDQDRSKWVDYNGMIYCLEVPNSVVMVRQNGYAYFSGNSKGSADQYVRDYYRIYGLRSVVFRQSAIYGYRQFGVEDQGWLAWFMIAAVLGRPINIYGDGKQVRDMLFIDDLLDAYDAALTHIDKIAGQVYNIGGGPRNTISVWTEFGPMLEKLHGQKIPIGRGDWRPGDQKVCVYDTSKAKRDLGWEPKVNVQDGVVKLYNWVKENKGLFE
ncbi:MAG: SDR family NAD(P)-dependent oxidoreductase [Chloroflexi bacterium]|nr:SDR family NAD(P)-dependent oxidoreductase [Chloroflexota bacterium]